MHKTVRDNGLIEIHNPTIDKIESGMMIRLKDNTGIIVVKTDKKKKLVSIGSSIGGTKERYEWMPVDCIEVVWKIGTLDYAMNKIHQFNGAVQNLLKGG